MRAREQGQMPDLEALPNPAKGSTHARAGAGTKASTEALILDDGLHPCARGSRDGMQVLQM